MSGRINGVKFPGAGGTPIRRSGGGGGGCFWPVLIVALILGIVIATQIGD